MKFRDGRKHNIDHFVTGRWVLIIKTDKDGQFKKFKARWVCRGFQDAQKWDLQTDSPTATRNGFRVASQHAPSMYWDSFAYSSGRNLQLRTRRHPRSTSIGHWSTTLSCWFVYSSGLRLSTCA